MPRLSRPQLRRHRKAFDEDGSTMLYSRSSSSLSLKSIGMDDRDPQQNQRLGALVRARRRELGLTQVELAARIERSPSYVSALESGSIAPSLTTLRQIASALSTVVAYFFEEQGTAALRAEPAA